MFEMLPSVWCIKWNGNQMKECSHFFGRKTKCAILCLIDKVESTNKICDELGAGKPTFSDWRKHR